MKAVKRRWFPMLCVGAILMQSAVALAASGICAAHCEQVKAEKAKHSCCEKQPMQTENHGCEGDCAKFKSSDARSLPVSYENKVETPVFDVLAVLPAEGALFPPTAVPSVRLHYSDSSPPPGGHAFSFGLRAPPVACA